VPAPRCAAGPRVIIECGCVRCGAGAAAYPSHTHGNYGWEIPKLSWNVYLLTYKSTSHFKIQASRGSASGFWGTAKNIWCHAARAPSGDRPAVPTSRFGVNRLVGSAAGRGTVSPGDVALAHGPARPDPSPPSAQTPRTAPCDAFPRRYVDPRVHGHPPPFLARRLESRWASDPGADGQREVSRGRGTKIPSSIKLCPGSDHHFYLFDPSCPTPPPACKLSCLA
jgi:hypothetical protein